MLSRVANSIHWMARYVERAENVARFVDVNLNLILDAGGEGPTQWEPLVTASGDRAAFYDRYDQPTRDNVVGFLTTDGDNPNSILSCLERARENARSVREIISSEMWEHLNRFYIDLRESGRRGETSADPHAFFTDVKMRSHLFSGITDATMSHSEAWHFARMGRLLERADKTSRILDVKYFILLPSLDHVGSAIDKVQWAALLRSASALEMYRKRHHVIAPEGVAEFLILDREFPRAIHHCILHADQSLHAITNTPQGSFQNTCEQLLGRLSAKLSYGQIEEIIASGLHEYLDHFQIELNEVGQAIQDTFFSLRPVAALARGQSQIQSQIPDPKSQGSLQ